MKKILALGGVTLMVMALVAGGTWAYFSDYEVSANNVLTAGTLDIGLSNASLGEAGAGDTATWSLSSMAPGDTKQAILYVANNGTIDMANVYFGLAYNTSGTRPSTVKAGPGGVTDDISKMIYVSAASGNFTSVASLLNKSIFDLSTQNITLGTLAAGQERTINLTWTMNTSATNDCQNKTVSFNATVAGTQN
jgi:predicted ribosomally synthesized peptide with SipW-like signal peptide